MNDHTALTAADVQRVAANADRHQLNRVIHPEILKNLDPNGHSIFSIVLPFRNRGIQGDKPHHRVEYLLKMKGETAPLKGLTDVLASDWDKLPEASPKNA